MDARVKLTERFKGVKFLPRIPLTERYSLENMAKQAGLSVKAFKAKIGKQIKIRQAMIDKQILNGLTPEQAETHVMWCLYIDGFSGPTFKD